MCKAIILYILFVNRDRKKAASAALFLSLFLYIRMLFYLSDSNRISQKDLGRQIFQGKHLPTK